MIKFKDLEESQKFINEWFVKCNFNKPENANKQYFKVISELGEVADGIAKERTEELKNELGDLGVTLYGLSLMTEDKIYFDKHIQEDIKTCLFMVHRELDERYLSISFWWYQNLVYSLGLDILECLTLSYNKIQSRLENGQLKVINGTIQK